MRKVLFLSLFFVSILVFKSAYCEDNILAVNVIASKQQAPAQAKKTSDKEAVGNNVTQALQEEEQDLDDDSEKGLKEMKAYHDLIYSKQKELEVIRLDLEKSSLLLKKKEAEKEIYQIDKALPQSGKEEVFLTGSLIQGVKEPPVDTSEIKIQLLLISDNLKEGIVTLKGMPYSFKEGDSVASKLTAEHIDPSGVSFKQPDGNVFKLNFIN